MRCKIGRALGVLPAVLPAAGMSVSGIEETPMKIFVIIGNFLFNRLCYDRDKIITRVAELSPASPTG